MFPDGLTVIDGYGQYRSSMGEMIRESARIVIIIHRNDDPTVGRFQRIRDAYRQRFDQESVLWVSQSCQATF
ncbi:MAG: DUF3574 domain-containing protein [Phycisphaeraceae bacterium]|nr:DUF3574 domain-containing protein [Phycisphaeraceae bacterium]